MSRVGKMPITIPPSVIVNIEEEIVKIKGPLGELSLSLRPELKAEIKEGKLKVEAKKTGEFGAYQGLFRSLLANMVLGVEKGWQKKLELVGVGYRALLNNNELSLSVGFSHPVKITAPAEIKFAVLDNTKITVSGIDKGLVGQIAAKIRKVRPPEPYQGKGIRYSGEYVRRKVGKAAAKTIGAK